MTSGKSQIDKEFGSRIGRSRRPNAQKPWGLTPQPEAACPYSEEGERVQWRGTPGISVAPNSEPGGWRRFHGGTAAAARQHTVLILAHLRHGGGEPHAGENKQHRNHKGDHVHDHAVTIVVLFARMFELLQILDWGAIGVLARRGDPGRRQRPPWPERENPAH